jgi:hypothetical protein
MRLILLIFRYCFFHRQPWREIFLDRMLPSYSATDAQKRGIRFGDLARPQAGGARMFKHLKDLVTYDERLHHADVTVRFPAPLSTENSESEAAQFAGAWDAASPTSHSDETKLDPNTLSLISAASAQVKATSTKACFSFSSLTLEDPSMASLACCRNRTASLMTAS